MRAAWTPSNTSSRAIASMRWRFPRRGATALRVRGGRRSCRCSVASTWLGTEREPPKLLEYNADTPTALLEASVAQWRWLEQAIRPGNPDADQFNSLHEKLIASWRAFAVTWSAGTPVHFTCAGDSEEDCGNLDYLRDVATQGGVDARFVAITDIGWDATAGVFVDDRNEEIRVLCKLYPWEWLAARPTGRTSSRRHCA